MTRGLPEELLQSEEVHDRANSVPGYDHDVQRSATIAIVGAGGVGCEVAEAQVRKGSGRIALFDHDAFEVSNLHRMKASAAHLGLNKAVGLAGVLADAAPYETEIVAHGCTIEEAVERGLAIEECAAVAALVDSEMTRVFLGRLCRRKGIPVVFAAISRDSHFCYAFVQTSAPGEPCYECLFPEAAEDTERSPCPAGSTIDAPKILGGLVGFALDSLVMPRRRLWNLFEVSLTGDFAGGPRVIERRADCSCAKDS